MFDALVFIGRFQPFHKGHFEVIRTALKRAKRVVVVVGSSFAPRNVRNPFTFAERKAMIEAAFDYDPRVIVVPVSDYPYNDNKWIDAVQTIVDQVVPDAETIGLIGHSKDSTSYYLDIFPRWKNHVEVPNVEGINATDIRKLMFSDASPEITNYMPYEAYRVLCKAVISDGGHHWKTLLDEYGMVQRYKEAWKAAPFPPTFVTVDAVVVQSGHLLLVERGDMPGKGLLALPGGFLNQEETLLDGMIRELKEETKIKVPVPVLYGKVKDRHTFDAPNRSVRGRTITTAFHIDLGFGELPRVKGSDDAAKAMWVPFKDVQQEHMFEDHYHIVDHFKVIGN